MKIKYFLDSNNKKVKVNDFVDVVSNDKRYKVEIISISQYGDDIYSTGFVKNLGTVTVDPDKMDVNIAP